MAKKIGAPREITDGEKRVALTPESAGRLQKLGYECIVESGAGADIPEPSAARLAVSSGMTLPGEYQKA